MNWCCSSTTVAESVDETEPVEIILRNDSPTPSRDPLRSAGFSEGSAAVAEPSLSAVSEPSDPSAEAPSHAIEDAPEQAELAVESEEAQEEEEDVGDGPFNVTLEMTPGERLGALLDVLDMKTLRVVEVREEGRLRLYNASVPDRERVLPGYYIVEVNGKSGKVEEMVQEMRRSRTWRLRVARKLEFTVTLEKSGPLCLDLQFEPESDCIVIRKIGEGVVRAYNQSLPVEGHQIKVGDRILGVNNAQAPARTLLESIRGNTALTMKIGRPLAEKAPAAARS